MKKTDVFTLNVILHTHPVGQVMHDEVSETENIRKNLAIERMIIEGCDILLDTSQVFVRQGRIIWMCLRSWTW